MLFFYGFKTVVMAFDSETDSGTSVVGQQVEESLSNFLSCERLRVLQAVQQRPDGVILRLSVHGSHSLPVRQLAFPQEVQDVPSGGNRVIMTNLHKRTRRLLTL